MHRLLFWAGGFTVAVASLAFSGQEVAGKWRLSRDKNPMNDKPIVTAMLRAENRIQGFTTATIPELVVRCQTRLEPDAAERIASVAPTVPLQPGLDFYIVIGMAASVENAEGLHRTHIRFDDLPATTQNGRESTDGQALMFSNSFATETIVLHQVLSKSKRMLVQFTPFNSSPAIAEFDVRGFAKHLEVILSACPQVDRSKWKGIS